METPKEPEPEHPKKKIQDMTSDERRRWVEECLRKARETPESKAMRQWRESTKRITSKDLDLRLD